MLTLHPVQILGLIFVHSVLKIFIIFFEENCPGQWSMTNLITNLNICTYNFKISNILRSFAFRWFKNSTMWWKVKNISKKQILTGSLENMFWWKPLPWFSHWRLPSSWVSNIFKCCFLLPILFLCESCHLDRLLNVEIVVEYQFFLCLLIYCISFISTLPWIISPLQ